MIQVSPTKPMKYIIFMGSNNGHPCYVMSYDVLVGRRILYFLTVIIDFWEEIAYYRP